jgi:lipoate-protein ligase A
MPAARLIIDSPASGSWNMAMDQALLESTDQTGVIALRFYQWSEPTLSLGYFQEYMDRGLHQPSLDRPVVRRSSGGGAILHDHEVTYSICVPSTNRWSAAGNQLYDLVHQQIIAFLDQQNVKATAATGHENSPEENKSFLCFQRRSGGDIVVDNAKVCGSAQRRLRNALLQHGSVLLKRSDFAPELDGLQELAALNLQYEEVCQQLADRIFDALDCDKTPEKPNQAELDNAKRIQATRFARSEWTRKR